MKTQRRGHSCYLRVEVGIPVTQAEYKLLHPVPGGRIEAARRFGVDLPMLAGRLRLTPEMRLEDLQRVMADLEEMRMLVRAHDKAERDAAPARRE